MEHYFSPHYEVARRRVLALARELHCHVASRVHPSPGMHGEQLATDVILVGPRRAKSFLVLPSGTHGCEALAGSAIQLQFLERVRKHGLPPETAAVLVHAVNPYGASYDQRQDENWVDLNRGFVDRRARVPVNHRYRAVHDLLLAADYEGPDWERCIRRQTEFARRHGEKALFDALGPAQFEFDDGWYFGGHSTPWSVATFREALSMIPQHAERVMFIDLHSGLGPWAKASVLSPAAKRSDEFSLARVVFPEVQSIVGEDTVAYEVTGSTMDVARELSPAKEWTCALSIEFGTVDRWECLRAAMARSFLFRSGIDPRSETGRIIRSRVREAYVPACTEWRRWVLVQARGLTERALVGLSVGGAEVAHLEASRNAPSFLELLQMGDQNAWESLRRNARRQLWQKLGESDAEDAANEVCLRMWRNIQSVVNRDAANAYLRRVIDSVTADAIRQGSKNGRPLSVEEVSIPRSTSEQAPADLRDILSWRWKLLTRTEQSVLKLRFQGLSYQEIGRKLEKSSGVVGTHLANARGKIDGLGEAGL